MVSIDDEEEDRTKAHMQQQPKDSFRSDEDYDDESDDQSGIGGIVAAGTAAKIVQQKYQSERLDTETKGDMLNEMQGNAI